MSVALQMVRAHILLAADCVGRFIKFRPTTNEQEIAELYCTTGFFILQAFLLSLVYSKYLTPKDLGFMLTIGSPATKGRCLSGKCCRFELAVIQSLHKNYSMSMANTK